MFGAPKPATGGIFGQSQQNQSAQQPQSTGLFGSKPAGSTSLFSSQPLGSTSQQPQQQQQQQPAQSGSLFGQPQAQQQNTNQGGFGTSSTLPTLGAGFGSNATSSKPTFGASGGFSLSGSNTANQQQQPFQLSQQQQQQQQAPQAPQTQQQQQQAQQPLITPFTRPSDLPESFQKEIGDMDVYIRQQAQLSEDLQHATSEHKRLVTSIPRDVQLLNFKLNSARETLKFDDGQLAKLKGLIDTDYSDTELLSEVTNQPRRYDRLLPYFRRIASCDSELDQLTMAMRDVQQAVTAEEFGNRVTYDEQGLRSLSGALKEEYMYFMSLSDRIAELHRHIKESSDAEALEETQF